MASFQLNHPLQFHTSLLAEACGFCEPWVGVSSSRTTQSVSGERWLLRGESDEHMTTPPGQSLDPWKTETSDCQPPTPVSWRWKQDLGINNIATKGSGSSEKDVINTNSENSGFTYGICHLIWDLDNRVSIGRYEKRGILKCALRQKNKTRSN